MQCPKCTTNGVPTRMHHDVTPLGAGSLDRYAESQIYSGYTCHSCGAWIDDAPVVAMPEIPPVEKSLVRPKGPRPQLHANNSQKYSVRIGKRNKAAVEKHLAFILEKRESGVNWETITDEFCTVANIDITDNTLRRYCRGILSPDLMMSLKRRGPKQRKAA